MTSDTLGTERSAWRDRSDIRDIIERWVIWRDTQDWDRFRTLWHDDGRMTATWTTSHVDDFIRLAREGAAKGSSTHFLGGQTIDLNGDRAISQTKMTISVRGVIDGIRCDIVCTGRFYDFLEYRTGRWGLVLRRCIYEKDRCDPIDTTQTLALDPARLALYPEGYQHLAYLQSLGGYEVNKNLPGASGPALEELVRAGAAWLAGTGTI